MTLNARSQHPDHALRENAEQRAHHGTHLAASAASDALFVDRGSGALGDANDALSVRAGTAVVDGTEYTLGTDTAIDIAGGDGDPRRDVVYLAPTGEMPDSEEQVATGDGAALGVREGTPGVFAWDSALAAADETISNAYRPPPPDFAGEVGYPLAVITVTANAGELPVGAITELRATAPIAASHQSPPTINAADHGVVGDGATDDTQALQDAITAAQDAGRPLFIPAGNYNISATVAVGGVTVSGAGADKTTLSTSTSLSEGITLGSGGSLEALAISGNDQIHEGIKINGSNMALRRVWVDGCSSAGESYAVSGISIVSSDRVTVQNCRITNISAPTNGVARGIRLAGSNGGRARITGCAIDSVTPSDDADGIAVQAVGGVTRISGCHITATAKSGIKINTGQAATVVGNHIRELPADAEAAIRIQANNTTVAGNVAVAEELQGGLYLCQTAPENVAIIGNIGRLTAPVDFARGIYDAEGASTLAVGSNTITMAGGDATCHGIELDGTTDAGVAANAVSGAGGDAINLVNGASAAIGINTLDATGAGIGGDLANAVIGPNIGYQRDAFRHPDGDVFGGLRAATPHAASGSGDVYLDDGANTGDGTPSWRVDTGAWTDI